MVLRRLFRDSGVLLLGSTLGAVSTLVALSLVARLLPVNDFGILVLVSTYALAVDRLVNFQSWQYVIKYGADRLVMDDRRGLTDVLSLGRRVDALTALTGFALYTLSIPVFMHFYRAPDNLGPWIAAYGLTIASNITGSHIGLLRLTGRYIFLSALEASRGVVRIIAVMAVAISNAPWPWFLVAWGLGEVVANLATIHQGIRQRHTLGLTFSKCERARRSPPGALRFLWTTNIHSSLKLGLGHFDVLLVGLLLQPAAAGTYKIAKQIGAGVARFSVPLYQLILPDLARAVANHETRQLRLLIYRPMSILALTVGLGLLAFIILGRQILELVFGPEHVIAYFPTIVFLLGIMMSVSTLPLHPALLAMGRPTSSLIVLVLSTSVYLALLPPLTLSIGLVGTASAYVVFYLVWAPLMANQVRKGIVAMEEGAHG